MGLVGSNIFEREALAEIRVNAGRTWEAGGGGDERIFAGQPGFAQSVRGEKVDLAALQLGDGLSAPVGTEATIFVNGNADIREGAA